MRIIYFSPLLFFFFLAFIVNAQEITTNKGGEQIVMFPDGSWRYYVPSDSVYLKSQQSNQSKFNINDNNSEENTISNNELTLTTKLLADLKKEKDALKKQIPALDRKIETVKVEYQTAASIASVKSKAPGILLNELNALIYEKDKINAILDSYTQLENSLNAVKNDSKSAMTKVFIENNLLVDLNGKDINFDQIITDYLTRRGSLALVQVIYKDYALSFDESHPISGEKTDIEISEPTEQQDAESVDDEDSINIQDENEETLSLEREDVVYEEVDMELAMDEAREMMRIQEYSNKILTGECSLRKPEGIVTDRYPRTSIHDALFFSYTPPETESFFKESDLIECYSYFSYQQGLYSLNLVFKINLPQARQSFGGFKKNAQLSLYTLDGKNMTFFATQASRSEIDAISGNTSYHVSYLLSQKDVNQLKKKHIDKIRVVWNAGYEDYTIFKVDLLQKQIRCLDSFL